MAEEEGEESSETIEDLFKKGQAEDEDAEADESAEPVAAEEEEEATAVDEADDGDSGPAEPPEPAEEPAAEETSVGDQLDEVWDEGNARGETDDGDESAPAEVEGDDEDLDAGGDTDGSASEEESPTEDTPVGTAEGVTATANGGTTAAGATAGGIDEDLLDADERAGPPQPGGGAERLTTGIEALDHHLGGGIPPGRIISFVATADTQSELLVKQLASQHDCLYLSTLRPKWEVQEEVTDYIQKRGAASSGQRVQIEQLTADSRLDAARRHVEALDRQSVVVVDAANELETSETDRYAYFIDEVKRALWDTGSVGLFYCIEEEQPPPGRAVTLRRADVVWRLRQSEEVGGIRHELLISKFRGGRALIEPLTLWLTDEVVMEEG